MTQRKPVMQRVTKKRKKTQEIECLSGVNEKQETAWEGETAR